MALDRGGKTPAFPAGPEQPGMTLEEWYAGLAMQGLLTQPRNTDRELGPNKTLAERAFQIAQKMIVEANKLAEKNEKPPERKRR